MNKIIKISFFSILFLCLSHIGLAQNIQIDSLKIKAHIAHLASDELQGRAFGSEGEKKAACYIRSQFVSAGCKLLYDNGFQEFSFNLDNGKNVVCKVRGTKKPEEYIVVGAHYDHLGMGGMGSRMPDTVAIHRGADDNASGVAVLIESAKIIAKQNPERSVIFVAFSGEESGLIGSRAFVEHSPVPRENIKAMINFDMVGNLDSILTLSGTGTALQFDSLISGAKDGYSFKIERSSGGFGPSDHASFSSHEIPVLHFQTTIGYDYYHTPFDVPEKINNRGAAEIGTYAVRLILDLAKADQTITYRAESGDNPMKMSRTAMKVTLGIMPNHHSENGLKIERVREHSVADKAGFLKNDIIVEINDQTIDNISTYMEEMQNLDKGQTVPFVILRNGERQTIIVTF